MNKRLVLGCLLIVILLGLSGCGGGSGNGLPGTGSMRFRVHFPAVPTSATADKVVPGQLWSLGVDVVDTATSQLKVPRVVVNREGPGEQTIEVTIPDVPIGPTQIVIKGYDQTDCQGRLITYAVGDCDVQLNQTATVRISMDKTVVKIVISGPDFVVLGSTQQLHATAYDIENGIVVTPLDWTSSDSEKAGVDQTGLVTGNALGEFSITVREPQHGVTATYPMRVVPVVTRVTATPSNWTANAGTAPFRINVVCYAGSTVEPNVPLHFTPADSTILAVTAQDAAGALISPLAPGETDLVVTQEYSTAQATVHVVVTNNGGIDVIVQ